MMLFDVSITPVGKGESIGDYVARCMDIVDNSGLDYSFDSMGTVIEGDWDEVMSVLKKCFNSLRKDCGRIVFNVKIDYRRGARGRIKAKVRSVEERLGRELKK